MTNFTQAQAKKEINAIAKTNGFILKNENATLNGKQLFKFENRITGRVLLSNLTFWSAYDNAQCCKNWLDTNAN